MNFCRLTLDSSNSIHGKTGCSLPITGTSTNTIGEQSSSRYLNQHFTDTSTQPTAWGNKVQPQTQPAAINSCRVSPPLLQYPPGKAPHRRIEGLFGSRSSVTNPRQGTPGEVVEKTMQYPKEVGKYLGSQGHTLHTILVTPICSPPILVFASFFSSMCRPFGCESHTWDEGQYTTARYQSITSPSWEQEHSHGNPTFQLTNEILGIICIFAWFPRCVWHGSSYYPP